MFLLGLPDSKKHKLAQPELLWKPPGAVKGKKTVFTKISNPYLRRIGAKSIPPPLTFKTLDLLYGSGLSEIQKDIFVFWPPKKNTGRQKWK